MTKLMTWILAIFAAIIICCVLIYNNKTFNNRVVLYVFHNGYWEFKRDGGQWRNEYFSGLNSDYERDKMVCGISEKDLRIKFPFLKPTSEFPIGGYKESYEKAIGSEGRKVLWFSMDDGFDWGVVLKDGIGSKIILVKG